MGSAVEKSDITRHLEAYRDAGLGGVEISPIYGAKGWEDRYIEYLSPEWLAMLDHTVAEARRLGLGVDMIEGMGWPFGGPNVLPDDAAAKAVFAEFTVGPGQRLESPLVCPDEKIGRNAPLRVLMASSDRGETLDLTQRVSSSDRLDWQAPEGATWTLRAVFRGWTGQKVKRAGLGGEGWAADHFSRRALDRYLARFDEAFAQRTRALRCFFNDSYEVFGADWTDDLFDEFLARRGYDLRLYLAELMGMGAEDCIARVKCDYRETVADLLLERFIAPWTEWTHARGSRSRNQAHGSPGNLVDLYAAADIPETEVFGSRAEPLLFKFASSAAHVAGKPLASSESFTWLREHFQGALADAKAPLDTLLLAGINHVFFHGMTYSPASEDWPGWLFYASTDFGLNSALWRDLPEFNAYIARSQSILQSGRPDNDVLLYFPIHDIWHSPDGMLVPLTCHNMDDWLCRTPFGGAAQSLAKAGYGLDYVSDRVLRKAQASESGISTSGAEYRVLVVPHSGHIPVETVEKMKTLVSEGATVVFHRALPDDVPGLCRLEERRSQLREVFQGVEIPGPGAVAETRVGKGRWIVGDDLAAMLGSTAARREPMVEHGIGFIRRSCGGGFSYFVVNQDEKAFDGWTELGVRAEAIAILDPLSGQAGMASARKSADGRAEVYLQVQPGGSLVLRTYDSPQPGRSEWRYFADDGPPNRISGSWNVAFVEGGPTIPAGYSTTDLASWTARDDNECRRFCGTARYAVSFQLPRVGADDWELDLGRVCESARVSVNGRRVATLWCAPFRVRVGEYLHEGENRLEIEVTNLAANRIADMDRRGVIWKKFHDANIARLGQRGVLDASDWPLRDSGLLGPVRLSPKRMVDPE